MTASAGSGATTVETAGDTPARELGAFLRRMRERVSPQSLGLSTSRRRRAPGLLREEVALAAGISATWYTWLEQGRRVRASVEVLEALAQVLRLDATERGHLMALARPELQTTFEVSADVPLDTLARWLETLPQPAYAFDSDWNLQYVNAAAHRLFGPFDLQDAVGGNLLRRIFLDPAWQALFEDWEAIARASTGQFRAYNTARLDAPAVVALVAELSQRSPHFARLWAQHPLAPPALRHKVLRHPLHGLLSFEFAVLRPEAAQPGLRVCLYSAADARTVEILAAL